MKRLKNKTFILSIVAFLVLVVKTFTNYQLPENFDTLVDMLLVILVSAGIISDPTTPGYLDDTDK